MYNFIYKKEGVGGTQKLMARNVPVLIYVFSYKKP